MDLSKPDQISTRKSTPPKKYKCPFCETEFTRHHNLKSHLLTHSQEKPFTCQTCDMKFRRLHDLKRHTKLHTGERPHICPKCKRKFARGDALVRHAKGSGGCAGRRSSIGSLGVEDDTEDLNTLESNKGAVTGIIYNNSTAHQNKNESIREEQQNFEFPSLPEENSKYSNRGEIFTSSEVAVSYPPSEVLSIPPSRVAFFCSNDDRSSEVRVAPHIDDTTVKGYKSRLYRPYTPPYNTGGNINSPQNATTEILKPSSPNGLQSYQFSNEVSSIDRLRSPNQSSQSQLKNIEKQKSNQSSLHDFSLTSPDKTLPDLRLPALTSLVSRSQEYKLSNEAGTQIVHENDPNANILPSSRMDHLCRAQNFNASQHQSTVSDKDKLFAEGQEAVWSYVQILEVKVRQLTDKIEEMKTNEKGQQEKINLLSKEILLLKNHLNTMTKSPSY